MCRGQLERQLLCGWNPSRKDISLGGVCCNLHISIDTNKEGHAGRVWDYVQRLGRPLS
jgi:hypothetical protein